MTALERMPGETGPSYAGPFRTALLIMACLAATIVGWGMYARLDAAVVTHGVMLAESQRKTVEHFEGGILRALLVKPGERVRAGQVVATLDATQVEAAIARLAVDRDALRHEIWRLAAEEAGAATLDPAAAPEPHGPQALAEARLFDARARAQAAQLAALDRQMDELRAQVAANEGVAAATERQLAIWSEERAGTESLVAKGATPRQKLLELSRTTALLEGDRDEARNLAAAAREGIARTGAERRALEQGRLVEIGERQVEARRALAGVEAELRAAADVLERSRLRAPQDGLVVHVNIVSPGAVVATGAPVMEIVPDGDRLVAETRLPPDAIDTVHVGRPAKVRLTAFKRAVAPTVDGEVIYVSADLLEDERDGEPYFEARVALDPASVAALGGVELTAGMPVEVAIRTGERRAGDYFLEPLMRHMNRAMRDE
ncbi:HlyD family type I secretion periplasmic adaptor subunit [Amaricoccus sp.]|uniref:HlyD family type I secretion periplasmic adaptor subunit n=1 Tax=Amaricoccus sp. TaxID=1872485 RepID=UPI001B721184|nr:HlyD family type I secretion periplasmic adaptor subunit [Amaricoccus sp.]MBP7241934.1 HlyD family type I secretion periplasmic adaptor subunit [Amaricoccus sp.]